MSVSLSVIREEKKRRREEEKMGGLCVFRGRKR
jgi:hypothetical protein